MAVQALHDPKVNNIFGTVNFSNDSANIAQALVTTSASAITIPAGQSTVRCSAAAAVTGATLPQGSYDGQVLIIKISTAAANTVTFAAAGTSFVAGGAAVSMAGLAAHMFIWDAVAALWFQVGPLTN